jgi:hypothetical protein
MTDEPAHTGSAPDEDAEREEPPPLSDSAGRFVGNAVAGFGSLARFVALLFGINLSVGTAVRSVAGVALIDLPLGYESLLGLLASGVVVTVADDRIEELSVGSVWLFGTVAFVVGLVGQTALAALNSPLRGSLWLTLDVTLVWIGALAVAFALVYRGGVRGVADTALRRDAVRHSPNREAVESELGDRSDTHDSDEPAVSDSDERKQDGSGERGRGE